MGRASFAAVGCICAAFASACVAPRAVAAEKEVLLDGARTSGTKPHSWKAGDGYLEVAPGGALASVKSYAACQLHVEWKPPFPASGSDQGRGNSGVFLGRYELQVLDSYESRTYATGQAGSIYGLYPPLVNACRPPDQWSAYEILFDGPLYEGRTLVRPPRLTAFHNGLVIHHDVIIWGQFEWMDKWLNNPHGPEGISFQNHNNPVRYRSIWVIPHDVVQDARMQAIDMARYTWQLTHQRWPMRSTDQPLPAVVTPGATPGAKPSDAAALTSADFASSGGSLTSRKTYPGCQLHVEWKRTSPIAFAAFGLELALPPAKNDWSSTDFVFSRGADGGTPYAIVTALHNGEFFQKRATGTVPDTTKVTIKGQCQTRNMWIRALGIYAGHDAVDRPAITTYQELFNQSKK